MLNVPSNEVAIKMAAMARVFANLKETAGLVDVETIDGAPSIRLNSAKAVKDMFPTHKIDRSIPDRITYYYDYLGVRFFWSGPRGGKEQGDAVQ